MPVQQLLFTQTKNVTYSNTLQLLKWVSELMVVVYLQMSNVQLISWREQVTFNEMIIISALYWTNTLNWIFIVTAHWINSQRIDMLLHSDTLSWFRTNQYIPSCYVLSREAANILIVFCLTLPGDEPTIYPHSMLTITPIYSNIIKNSIYYLLNVEMKWKAKNTTLSEQF